MGYSPWGRKELDTTEQLTLSLLSQVRKLRHEDEPALPHPTTGHLASGRDRIWSRRCDPWSLFLDTSEAAWSPRWDSCPLHLPLGRGQREAEFTSLRPFQSGCWARFPPPSVDPVPHPPQSFGHSGGWATSPSQGGFPSRQSLLWAQTKGQRLCLRLCLSSCSRKVQPDSWHHQPFRNHSTPCLAFPLGAGHPFLFPLQAAAQPLRPGSPSLRLPLTVCFTSSLRCPLASSRFTRCFLRRCSFSYNIMSDPDFPKSTLSRLAASPEWLLAGLDRGPSSVEPPQPLCLTPFRKSQYTFSYQKPPRVLRATNPSTQKQTRYPPSRRNTINRMHSTFKNTYIPYLYFNILECSPTYNCLSSFKRMHLLSTFLGRTRGIFSRIL